MAAANNDTTNSIAFVQGLVEDSTDAQYSVEAKPAASGILYLGIGLNVTNSSSAPQASTIDDSFAYLTTSYQANLPLGANIPLCDREDGRGQRRHL
jgi:hypothetical protein